MKSEDIIRARYRLPMGNTLSYFEYQLLLSRVSSLKATSTKKLRTIKFIDKERSIRVGWYNRWCLKLVDETDSIVYDILDKGFKKDGWRKL